MRRECLPVGPYLYRIHDTSAEVGKATDYTFCTTSETYCYRYRVLSVTDCGAWISRDGGKRFVLLDAYKIFACETIERAVESFKKRKARQLKILQAQVNRIKWAESSVDSSSHMKEEKYQKELTEILDL